MSTNVVEFFLSRELGGSVRSRTSNRYTSKEIESKLKEWVTNEASKHCLSECCILNNTPRSTIAATINKNGTLIASTHGDHTVKLVSFQTGEFLKEFVGHRRTPWTVKFHPLYSNLLVSGSLDYEIKVWDTDTGTYRQSKDFGKQISSVSFHPSGKALAIAAGHNLHLWEFDEEKGLFEEASECIHLANCSIRTVHFDPVRGDMIMVSERVDLPSPPPPQTAQTSNSEMMSTTNSTPIDSASNSRPLYHPYLCWNEMQPPPYPPPPSVYQMDPQWRHGPNMRRQQPNSRSSRRSESISNRLLSYSSSSSNERNPQPTGGEFSSNHNSLLSNLPVGNSSGLSEGRSSDAILRQIGGYPQNNGGNGGGYFNYPSGGIPLSPPPLPVHWGNGGTSSTGISGASSSSSIGYSELNRTHTQIPRLSSSSTSSHVCINGRVHGGNLRHLHLAGDGQTIPSNLSVPPPVHTPSFEISRTGQTSEMPPIPSMIWYQVHNAMPSMPPLSGGNDRPHVTKLVLYSFDINDPCAPLTKKLLQIDYAVICSEMGAHISPCGRMLVVCVASVNQESAIAGQREFNYELRVISLEKQTFGEILRSRFISAGHCLTSVQFSPGSDMILLSYGRKHASLLRYLEMNGETVAQIHTLLELYSAKTLNLVRVMHSGEDEANTASFHPFAGEGIIYGTKNGKLRILRHTRSTSSGDGTELNCYETELLEVSEDDSG